MVLLTKTDRFSREAQSVAQLALPHVEIAEGFVGDPRPASLSQAGGVLISFLSPWIVTADELARFPVAINFHPASVEYPGTGCYNFALYDEAPEYGAVCHHMLPKVDTGRVVLERRFPVAREDTVETLKLATMHTMLGMFREILGVVVRGEVLPSARTHWTRKPYTHREMEALKVLTDDMPSGEIARRVRATVYPGYPGPVMRHRDGSTTVMPVPDRPALA
ncbi:MAG TPA: formyltransferase family protein [Croceibacterium sp.]|nr:formyltransferase family protein [Croceibacterium sp.]